YMFVSNRIMIKMMRNGHFFKILLFFFFSSRRRHTRSKRDWSSDVCSSDLTLLFVLLRFLILLSNSLCVCFRCKFSTILTLLALRSEERRVGKECRYWW